MDDEVKVRIALAIDHKGDWVAIGGSYYKGNPEFGEIIDTLEPNERRYYIDAIVQKPDDAADVIQGEVSEA